jgi:hypothetical protein
VEKTGKVCFGLMDGNDHYNEQWTKSGLSQFYF